MTRKLSCNLSPNRKAVKLKEIQRILLAVKGLSVCVFFNEGVSYSVEHWWDDTER
jgi:hypothetical protein